MSHKTAVLAALAAALLAGAAWAHHNMSAVFDFNDRVTLTGTLAQVDWRNPHIALLLDVQVDGQELESWSIEGPPPGFFRTRDVNKTHVEAALGKMVTAEASRARDGSQSGLLRTMTLPGGEVLSACPQNC
jgi:Family of unknown function (DUF6152)